MIMLQCYSCGSLRATVAVVGTMEDDTLIVSMCAMCPDCEDQG